MKNLYRLDRLTLFALFLIYAFSGITAMVLANEATPEMGRVMELVVYVVGLIIGFVIYYGIMYLILKNSEFDFQKTIFVNIAIGLIVVALLSGIVGAITNKGLNIWVKVIVGLLGNGLTIALNWKYLQVSQSSKIKVSILSVLSFFVSVI
ncbi:hypothetical protein M5C72_00555 [Companilactobacillus allii]|uniref:Uncharacterized protein n=1 Tax=Companilactobacillus allii TaxID=1847728 RepID=A0A1P8Q1C1_9LACO|nr:hypothetical protein [Companilactobacillus allii]APX71674.1 hypothetical protein BTM29_03480 [Companilactobacillus allii]USQ68759.1 hypothetical protein M5C72_00555 [Companilactobacillus allii]